MGLHGVRELVHVESRSRLVFVYFMISSILSKYIILFGIDIPKLLMFLGYIS